MPKKTWLKTVFVSVAFLFFLFYALDMDAFARVGGGRSSGSRGSRSFSSPSRSYSSPSRPSSPYQSYPSSPGQRSFGGSGFFRGMMGGIAGGFLGSMLFRGLGFGHGGFGGFGGGGIGLFDILLLAAVLYVIYRFVKKRRQRAAEARTMSRPGSATPHTAAALSARLCRRRCAGRRSPGRTRLDTADRPLLRRRPFSETCMDAFLQSAGPAGPTGTVARADASTDEMYRIIQDTPTSSAWRKNSTSSTTSR
jgi:uncharacterized membrane protein